MRQTNQSRPGNQNANRHGAEGAIKRIATGQPFLGAALEAQHQVEERLELNGLESLVEENAVRVQTVTDLYYQAVLKAAQDGETAAFDRYVARFGWIAGVTLRAWAQVKQDRKASGGLIGDVLDAYAKDMPRCHQEATGGMQNE